MHLPVPQSMSFNTLMSDIEKGLIKIPQFQRDFVWSKDKSAKLLDSIIKGYPIGTFIFWKTKDELKTVKNIGKLKLPPTPEGDYIDYVLDGQQRLTSLFACLKGLKIYREDHEDDYSEFYVDLETVEEEEPIVVTSTKDGDENRFIKLNDLLYGKLKTLTAYPEHIQERIQEYKDRINAYHFSAIQIKEASIDVATEIFTRINVTGKPLSVFEIMVAKTFDAEANFDLSEKFDELVDELRAVGYDTIPDSTVLQTVSVLLVKECKKRDILRLKREDVIKIWPEAADAIRSSVDYFRNYYRIPVSRLLPYPSLLVPFSYYFHKHKDKPTGDAQKYLQDFFWRVSLGGRYSQSVEGRVAQDLRRIDAILKGKLPKYDWAVDISADFIDGNGWFSLSRSYIKALLCILAYQEPKSFIDNSVVRINNDWLKQANSRNYHHFFPRAFLKKLGEEEYHINHIANITIVDDFLNKREIKAKAPSKYMKKFIKDNPDIDTCMRTHLIRLKKYGVLDDNYDTFHWERCRAFNRELKKRIIEQDIDHQEQALSAEDTIDFEEY